jgi:hypothetical protein
MLRFPAGLAITLALVMACGDAEPVRIDREVPADLPDEGALLRLPHEGGAAALYRADSLIPFEWRIGGGVPPIRRALGTDLEDRMVYAEDADGRLVGIDLLARRPRVYLSAARELTATADGVVLGLDSMRRPIRFAGRELTTYRTAIEGGSGVTLLRAPSQRVSAFVRTAGTMQVINAEGEVRRATVPGVEATATWFGELVAITSDSGVAFVTPGDTAAPVFHELGGDPRTAAFSPSGHRLYVARGRGDLVMLDRFTQDEVGQIDLPAPARALRVDRSGRWLLARPESGDSVWVIDLAREELAGSVRSPWAEDLPLVVGARTLVVRDGQDVVARDITAADLTERTRLVGAAGDVFLAVPWTPRTARPTETVAEAAPVTVAAPVPDTVAAAAAPATPAPAEPSGPAAVWVQVTASQSAEYAQALADQLRATGFPSRVLQPRSEGDPFRVVVGPYPSREEAEAVGRRLGRPNFLTTLGPTDT